MKVDIGDLVEIRMDDFFLPVLPGDEGSSTARGIVVDLIEDNLGYHHVEVQVLEEAFWLEDCQVKVLASAGVGQHRGL